MVQPLAPQVNTLKVETIAVLDLGGVKVPIVQVWCPEDMEEGEDD